MEDVRDRFAALVVAGGHELSLGSAGGGAGRPPGSLAGLLLLGGVGSWRMLALTLVGSTCLDVGALARGYQNSGVSTHRVCCMGKYRRLRVSRACGYGQQGAVLAVAPSSSGVTAVSFLLSVVAAFSPSALKGRS